MISEIVQWEISEDCSNLFTLVRQLDIYTSHGLFPYNRLNALARAIEDSSKIRAYVSSIANHFLG